MELPTRLLCFVLIGIAGCPVGDSPSVEITRIDVDGDPHETAFDLNVHGRGFGLNNVTYDVDEGTGTARDAHALGFRLFNMTTRLNERSFGRAALQIRSPRRIDAKVRLNLPLPPGSYGFALLQETEVLAMSAPVFEILDRTIADRDAGAGRDGRLDSGFPGGGPSDSGIPDNDPPDTGPPDADTPDAGTPDAGAPDALIPDAGPPDGGEVYRPDRFFGSFQYRAPINLSTTMTAPAGTTIRIPIEHDRLITEQKARADGTDIVVTQGPALLEAAWDDPSARTTERAALIVALAEAWPAGGNPDRPLMLYYGDSDAAHTPNDAVFTFVERFEATLPREWFVANWWDHCIALLGPGMGRLAYCIDDRGSGLQRKTIATPPLDGIPRNPGPGLEYEMSFHLAGRQGATSPNDILYLAHYSTNGQVQRTVQFPADAFDPALLVPDDTLTFADRDGTERTVTGWRFPTELEDWSRVRLQFRPRFEPVSFHLRFVSPSDASESGLVIIDDWWVRLRLQDVEVQVGPEEARPMNP